MVQAILARVGDAIGGEAGQRIAAMDAKALIDQVKPKQPGFDEGPVGEAMVKVSLALPDIADALDKHIAREAGGRIPFALWVFTQGRMNYISNVDRAAVIDMMENVLKGWKAGMPDIPAHKVAG